MNMIKYLSTATLLCSSAAFVVASDDAEMSIQQKIETRQEIMKNYKSWDKKLDIQFKAEQPDADALKQAAQFFQMNSGDVFLDLFPDTATPTGVKTSAKDGIWRSWDEFSAISNDVNLQATQVLQFISNGDITSARNTMSDITDSCRSCHKKFKAR